MLLKHALTINKWQQFWIWSWEKWNSNTQNTFSRMRSKGSRFTLKVWGLSFVRQKLRNRSQPSATVRDPPRSFATVRVRAVWLYGKLCKRDHSWSFRARVASFRVAHVALCDIPTCFMSWRVTSGFDVILRGKHSTLIDVSCCVLFCDSHCQLREVATTCKFRGRRGMLWHVMKIDGSLARDVDFEVDP